MPEIETNGEKKYVYVTNNELETKLNERPTRWEMRTLILLAIVANQLIPALNLISPNGGGNAGAIGQIMGLFT